MVVGSNWPIRLLSRGVRAPSQDDLGSDRDTIRFRSMEVAHFFTFEVNRIMLALRIEIVDKILGKFTPETPL